MDAPSGGPDEDDDPAEDNSDIFFQDDDELLPEALFTLPESFDDDVTVTDQDLQSDDVIFLAGDIDCQRDFDETEAVTILGNWQQVRKHLQKRKLGRNAVSSHRKKRERKV